jgi:heme exporter protein C
MWRRGGWGCSVPAAAVVAGVAYLVSNRSVWDSGGRLAAVEIGLVFMLINIVTGSIWARPIWNTWWTWDPRLTTATIMELVLRRLPDAAFRGSKTPTGAPASAQCTRSSAFISVPLTFSDPHLPHHSPGGDRQQRPRREGVLRYVPPMLQTFLFSLFVFSIIFVVLMWHRTRLGQLADKVEQLKLKIVQ